MAERKPYNRYPASTSTYFKKYKLYKLSECNLEWIPDLFGRKGKTIIAIWQKNETIRILIRYSTIKRITNYIEASIWKIKNQKYLNANKEK